MEQLTLREFCENLRKSNNEFNETFSPELNFIQKNNKLQFPYKRIVACIDVSGSTNNSFNGRSARETSRFKEEK